MTLSHSDEALLVLLYGDGGASALAAVAGRLGRWRMPYCESPIPWELFQGQRDVHPLYSPVGSGVIYLPCRKCPACQFVRRRMWFARIKTEVESSARTWFVTLTFRTAPADPVSSYREVQLYLKRLRKSLGPSVRYFAVAEEGEKRGRLHWHMMLHCASTVTRRMVEAPWIAGFSKAKLIWDGSSKLNGDDAIGYLAHYGSKSMLKVHASRRYGRARLRSGGTDTARESTQRKEGLGKSSLLASVSVDARG